MNQYSKLTDEQLEEHFSNYLIDAWSYSKVSTFARNEKDFERCYIYNEISRRSSTSVAGNAYHEALAYYFDIFKKGKEASIIDLELIAHNYIEEVPANMWKLQKTTPTIEDCKIKAIKSVNELIRNFYAEKSLYLDDIEEIIGIELVLHEWVEVNGVDIPLPCNAVIDLVFRSKDNKVIIVDHKSKAKYTDDKEVNLVFGKQGTTYMKAYETNSGTHVDEVWFIENKSSKNRDNSAQMLRHKIILDQDTRRLNEAMLYEGIKRMIEAVNDPDYVYTINDSDNFVDKAELYAFWMKSLIAEVDDFNIAENKKDIIEKRLRKIRDASLASINPKVISSFKKNAASFISYDYNSTDMTNSEKIEHLLCTFALPVEVKHEISGFSSNTFLIEVGAGVPLSKVINHKLDIANVLNVKSIRMGKELVVYQGKSYLAAESSKQRTENLLWDEKYLNGMKIPLGLNNFRQPIIWDLDNHSTPHMLVCGATGSGKSVSIRSTIEYAKKAGINDIHIFDPKFEFCHLTCNTITVYNDIEEIEKGMKSLVDKMQQRVKNADRNKVLIIFDEFADAVANARSGKELDIKEMVQVGFYAPKKDMEPQPKMALQTVGREKSLEENLKILLQKGRSLGFRILSATQRASVKVITGDAKANFPVQLCFRVPKEIDSKVVIDESGAELLAGLGDALLKSPEYLDLQRIQAFYKPV